jgi:hypothetical protein
MGQGDEGGAVGGERPPQLADLAAHPDQYFNVLVGSLAAHGLDIKVLQALLDSLERGRVGPEHPFEQGGEETGAVQRTGIAGARGSFGRVLSACAAAFPTRPTAILNQRPSHLVSAAVTNQLPEVSCSSRKPVANRRFSRCHFPE